MQIEKNPLRRIGKHPLLWGCLLLTAVTVLNNWPMAAFGFAWDDHGYVVKNYPIQDPVSLKSILWCLTAFAEANWHPMTWLALHLQFQFFGLNPGGYHVTNLLLHIANTLLLYALLYRTTRAAGKSLFVAALFSVHPLHIESVAWISEIKDVLSTFFFLLMLHAYVSYSRRPGLWRYGLVGLLLALGLASKPMLVTAPFVLLLLDYWPLGRWTGGPEAALPDAAGPRFPARRLILEKLPFFAMIGVVCVLTFLAQREGGAVSSLAAVPLFVRIGNIVNSYIMYVWRMAWPWPLSFFYPYEPVPIWRFLLCLSGLLFLTLIVWQTRKTKPYLLFGWLLYLGTLIPVIGIIQVGSQALADRYTYIPSIGVFIALTWFLDDVRRYINISALLPATLMISAILTSMCVSLNYLLKWINEEELYSYGLDVNENNPIALNNYGLLLYQKQNNKEAAKYFTKNLQNNPTSPGAKMNLAIIYLNKNDPKKALDLLLSAQSTNQNDTMPYILLSQVFKLVNDKETARKILAKALDLPKDRQKTTIAFADLLLNQGEPTKALEVINEELPLSYDKDPFKAVLLWLSGQAYYALGNLSKAQELQTQALQLQPIFPGAHHELSKIALAENNFSEAIDLLKKTLKAYALDPKGHILLGCIYSRQGRQALAYTQFRRALKLQHLMDTGMKSTVHEEIAALLRHFGQTDAADIHSAQSQDLRRPPPPHLVLELRQRLHNALAAK